MKSLIAASVREEERRARAELAQGCESDLSRVERFVSRPATRARTELHLAILSIGNMDAQVRRRLIADAAQEAATGCARRAFSNADVRFRARFRIYADALAAAQDRVRRGPRRRIALPHLEPNCESSLLPRTEASIPGLDAWTRDLRRLVEAALLASVETARRLIERRGRESMARDAIAARNREGFR